MLNQKHSSASNVREAAGVTDSVVQQSNNGNIGLLTPLLGADVDRDKTRSAENAEQSDALFVRKNEQTTKQ